MGKRSELKENVLASKVETGLKWILERKVHAAIFCGVLVFGGLVSSVFILRQREQSDLNWTRLAQAQSLLRQRRFSQSKQILKEVKDQTPGQDTALFSSYYIGEIQIQEKNFDEAELSYQSVLSQANDSPIKALALANLGFVQEEKNNFADATITYQQFINDYADHFLAPKMQLALGRAYAKAGNVEQSRNALNTLVDLYPTSPWAENARRILDKLESR